MGDYEKVLAVCKDIRSKVKLCQVEVGIICGSGLGVITDEITEKQVIPYIKINGFPVCTVKGHEGALVFGKMGGKSVVVMQGRFHPYEGYTFSEIALPIRMMHFLGAKTLFITNACGGSNPDYKPGDIMVIRDHLDLSSVAGHNPLVGPNDERFGTRFPDMRGAYTKSLRELAKKCAKELNEKIYEGVYCYEFGPVYETPSIYGMMRLIGADVIGMSTTQEAIVARHLGMQCFGLSVITDLAIIDDDVSESNHEEVLRVAQLRAPIVARLLKTMLTKM